ncbi:MAG: hypothetical protein HZB64_08600 [Rhodocyclales bacterium]|nr:hypothetical protein [Rhodocyclales bacterium]
MPLGLTLKFAVLLGCIIAGGIVGYKFASGNVDKTSAIVATINEPIVMRTKGGLLEVSTITATELFQTKTTHTALGLDVGKTITQIRVPATYRYHIELAPKWRFEQKGDSFIVIAPPVKPSLPVAIDTTKFEVEAHGVWSLITGPEAKERLLKGITPTLAEYAASKKYVELQRSYARETISEFVRKWVVSQEKWSKTSNLQIRVFFADESIQAMQGTGLIPL